MERYINAPLTDEDAKSLHSGDYVYITGTIYTARDAAHLRMCEALDRNETLPLELAHNIIYYMGPSPAREGATPHWFRGSYDSQPYGQVHAKAVRPWSEGNDRKGKAQ